jgi:ankyrin repeat protein/class 3 adenylate cyclase
MARNKSSIERKPFANVVQEWITKLGLNQPYSMKTEPKSHQPLTSMDNEESFRMTSNLVDSQEEVLEKYMREMNQLNTVQDRLIFACKSDCSDDVSYLLLEQTMEQNPGGIALNKIEDKQQSNCSLLHLLAQRNKVKCMEWITRDNRFSNLDICDSISSTPLLYAVAHDSEDAVAFLLSKGKVNPNVKDIYNKFPLLLALRNKNYKVAEMLLNTRGIDIHMKGTKGNTVLHTMVEEGDLKSVQFLVEKGASAQRRNNNEQNCIYLSLAHLDVAHYLATEFSKRGLGKMLLNLDTMGRNVMHKVADDGFFDSILVIFGTLPIGELSQSQISSLLNTTDKNGDTPLILAVKNGRRDVVHFLCSCIETNVNDGDRNGYTPLHHAATKEKAIADILMSVGASLKATNIQDESEEKRGRIASCLKSLRTVLAVLLVSFSIFCILTIAAVCISFFGANVASSANTIREQDFQSVISYLNNSFHTHATIEQTGASQIFDSSDMNNVTRALRITFDVVKSNYLRNPLLTSCYVYLVNGSSAGTLTTVSPIGVRSTVVYDSFQNPSIQNVGPVLDIEITTWTELQSIKLFPQPQSVNYSLISYAGTQKNSFWPPSYVIESLPFVFFSLITPIYDVYTNAYLGYFGLDGNTLAMLETLVSLSNNGQSVIAVLEGSSGYLLGSSDPTMEYFYNVQGNVVRNDGTSGGNSRITSMIEFARSKYGGTLLPAVKPNQFIYAEYYPQGQGRVAVNIARLTDQYGLDLLILQSLPMDTYFKTLATSLGVMFALTFILLCLSIILSIFAARIFMLPLIKLISQAEDIKMLQLEKVETDLAKGFSMFTEINSLQHSFNSMAARLKQFRSFIPSHILAVIDAEIGENKFTGATGASNQSKVPAFPSNDAASHSSSHSDSRGTSVSSFVNTRGMVSRALKSKLSSGSITIMTIRISDLSEILEMYSSEDVSETTKDLINAIKTSIQESLGQLVTMSSKKVVIVWNSFIPQSDHRTRACRTAHSFMNNLEKIHTQWKQKNLPILKVYIGVCSGTVYFGNIGSDSTKFFTIIGKASKLSKVLCNRNKQWGTRVLVSEDIYDAVKEEFYFRPVERLNNVMLHELGSPKHPDEWVDELNTVPLNPDDTNANSKENDVWKEYREGYDLVEKNMYSQALQKFNVFLAKYPYDILTQKLMETCRTNLNDVHTKHEDLDIII